MEIVFPRCAPTRNTSRPPQTHRRYTPPKRSSWYYDEATQSYHRQVYQDQYRRQQNYRQSRYEQYEPQLVSTKKQETEIGGAPWEREDGGLRAWLVVFAAFAATMCTSGYINAFGVYQTYYSTHFLSSHSASDIAWIGSLQLFLIFLVGAVSGPLADLLGYRVVITPSSAILVFSVVLTSFSTKYIHFLLAQGVLGGAACGMIYAPSISVVGQYFTRRRAFAMGIASCGAPVGGTIFPIVLGRLLAMKRVGFAWAVRAVAGVMTLLLVCTAVLLVEKAPRRSGRLWAMAAFRSMPYVVVNIGAFLGILGVFTPVFGVASYAVQRGFGLQFALYQISVLNCVSIFGRIGLGFMADRAGKLNTMALSMGISAALIFCWTSTTSKASVVVFSVLYGFWSGPVISLYPACVAQITESRSDIGTWVGMGMATISLAGLAGTPIAGALVHAHHGFSQAAIFSGTVMASGTCITALARFLLRRELLTVV